MAKIKLYLDQRKPCKDGKCPVKVSVYMDAANRFMVGTGVMMNPKNWDAVKCVDRRSAANNAVLEAVIDKVKVFVAESIKNGTAVNSESLRAALAGRNIEEDSQLLLPYFREHAATKKAPRTRDIYIYTAQKIEEFAGVSVHFDDVTHKWLQRFDDWLALTSPSANARSIHLRNIRTVFNAAIDDEITTHYPFRKFKIKTEETQKRSLTVDQLRHIFLDPVTSGDQYRDIFCLIFLLQGINIWDLCNLRVGDYDGTRIYYKRAKTGKQYSVKVEPEAAAIIERWHGKGGVYLLDILERWQRVDSFKSKMNKRLKQMYPELPPLSTYWARHSYATMLAEIDTPMEVISQALGHSYGSRVTAIYINPNQKKVDDANRKLIDFIWKKKPA